MKNLVLFACCLIVFTACHRKTVPAATNTSATASTETPKKPTPAPPPKENTVKPLIDNETDSSAVAVFDKPVIVVDGKGNMVSQDQLPAGVTVPDNSAARAFTPAQTKNLAYRYKYIPPRILYVPDNLARTTSRGTYYVYNKKFWYWKKSDGFFYLDPNYYN
ncbi:MAG: hypothetical protein ACTHJ5_16580 [Ilyomonas sp.]